MTPAAVEAASPSTGSVLIVEASGFAIIRRRAALTAEPKSGVDARGVSQPTLENSAKCIELGAEDLGPGRYCGQVDRQHARFLIVAAVEDAGGRRRSRRHQ